MSQPHKSLRAVLILQFRRAANRQRGAAQREHINPSAHAQAHKGGRRGWPRDTKGTRAIGTLARDPLPERLKAGREG